MIQAGTARRILLWSLPCLFAHEATGGGIVYVDAGASPGGDGASWGSAYRFLQDGFAAAAGGATTDVRVAGGTYLPDRSEAVPGGAANRFASFVLLDRVSISGGYAGAGGRDPDERDVGAYPTVLSGDITGDDGAGMNFNNSFHVVRSTGASSATVLDGLTIRGGYADGTPGSSPNGGGAHLVTSSVAFRNVSFLENRAVNSQQAAGGAVYSVAGAPTFENCSFVANLVTFSNLLTAGGGAVQGINTISPTGALTFIDCLFAGNEGSYGGAIFTAVKTTVVRCVFEANEAARGGAIFRTTFSNFTGELLVVDTAFTDNTAYWLGGAIDFFTTTAPARVLRSRFLGNQAQSFGGGAIAEFAGDTELSNCLFAGNTASGCGGAIEAFVGAPLAKVVNCTLTGNVASKGGGFCVGHANAGQPVLVNSVFWANQDSGGTDESAQIDRVAFAPLPIVHYCLVQGLTGALGGVGNMGGDPLFLDPDGSDDDPATLGDNDYRPGPGSPAIDAGNNACVPIDALDGDGDGDLGELVPLDMEGKARFTDDPAKVDAGCGMPVQVDLGAREARGDVANPVVLGDTNGDASVGFADLSELLGHWGPCPADPACCLSDLNLSGGVGFEDLSMQLANWGG